MTALPSRDRFVAPVPTKHHRVFASLRRDIESGRYAVGDRLPSEAELVRLFGLSRITVGRALRDLQAEGLIERRAGSGTYVRERPLRRGLSFGLLIPNVGETEIFEPLCEGMMASPMAQEHELVWGGASGAAATRDERAWQLCRHFLDRGVAGVFFAPLEHSPDKDVVNQRIVRALDEARIPLVLLDRPIVPYPLPSPHDVVGIDHRAAGYVVTDHLLAQGCRRLAFVAVPHSAATVDAREAGFREALHARGLTPAPALVARLEPEDDVTMGALLAERPDGIVCANDRTAGRVLHALRRRGRLVPRDVRLVGIDDVAYAPLLPVPLTTLRQPARLLGEVAMAVMLQRVARRDLPARDTRIAFELVIRESCGATARR